jgi:hypothetical protein
MCMHRACAKQLVQLGLVQALPPLLAAGGALERYALRIQQKLGLL